MRVRVILATLALAAVTTTAFAQQPAPGAAAPGAAAPAKAGEPRRDPAGQTGISPYMEQIAKGQAAFVARDIQGAVAAFQEAIKIEPDKMLGFYRLGEAMLESGKLEDAEAAWNTATGKKGTSELQAKVLLCLADLRERQKNFAGAKDAWNAYTKFVTENAKANGYPATPAERLKQIERREKDEKDYAAVRERIKNREAERQKEAEENAKKDTKNR